MRIIAPMPKKKLTSKAKLHGDFTTFMSKKFQIWDHFSKLLFTKDSDDPKSLDIWLWEVGEKKRLNGVNKWKNPEWHIPPDTWHITHHTWNLTLDMWNITHWEWLTLSKNSDIWLWQFRSNGVMWQMKLDMWHGVTCDMRHVTWDKWHVTGYTWHVTHDTKEVVKIISKCKVLSSNS